jgi:hypothetical protein
MDWQGDHTISDVVSGGKTHKNMIGLVRHVDGYLIGTIDPIKFTGGLVRIPNRAALNNLARDPSATQVMREHPLVEEQGIFLAYPVQTIVTTEQITSYDHDGRSIQIPVHEVEAISNLDRNSVAVRHTYMVLEVQDIEYATLLPGFRYMSNFSEIIREWAKKPNDAERQIQSLRQSLREQEADLYQITAEKAAAERLAESLEADKALLVAVLNCIADKAPLGTISNTVREVLISRSLLKEDKLPEVTLENIPQHRARKLDLS